MIAGYQCENCRDFSTLRSWFFICVWCEKEICGNCVSRDSACKECAAKHSQEELRKKYREYYDITED